MSRRTKIFLPLDAFHAFSRFLSLTVLLCLTAMAEPRCDWNGENTGAARLTPWAPGQSSKRVFFTFLNFYQQYFLQSLHGGAFNKDLLYSVWWTHFFLSGPLEPNTHTHTHTQPNQAHKNPPLALLTQHPKKHSKLCISLPFDLPTHRIDISLKSLTQPTLSENDNYYYVTLPHMCNHQQECHECTSLKIKPNLLILNALDTGEILSPWCHL